MVEIRRIERATEAALRLAEQGGVHGMYVRNALLRGEVNGFVFGADGADAGVCWFGPRGNLVVVAPDWRGDAATTDEAGQAVAERIQRSRLSWRIAMGPRGIIDGLRTRCTGRPLVHRNQVYYFGDAESVNRELVRDDMRAATAEDRDRIVQATLQLNHVDLAIEPGRVDRRWLYSTVDERIAEGTTRVLGPAGDVHCKLDFGSIGSAWCRDRGRVHVRRASPGRPRLGARGVVHRAVAAARRPARRRAEHQRAKGLRTRRHAGSRPLPSAAARMTGGSSPTAADTRTRVRGRAMGARAGGAARSS